MIYIEVNFSMFCDQFHRMNRNENFSYEGKRALFDYLDEISGQDDKGQELDVIALCCDYSEYTLEELHKEYGEDDETPEETLERVKDQTMVLEAGNENYVIQAF